MLMFYSTDI